MKIIDCEIPGPKLIIPQIFGDDRGFFMESWNAQNFADAGLNLEFVQDNHSHSCAGVLRGLHFQNPQPQGKLVRVVQGAIYDVIVDLRQSSAHFGQWAGFNLNSENRHILWVPEGFAHGFLTMCDNTDVLYKCTAPYAPGHEYCLAWDDPDLAIDWPLDGARPMLSQKDQCGIQFKQAPYYA